MEQIVNLMLDFVRQGHQTFDINFPISGSNKARAIDFSLFLMCLGSRIELENIK